MLTLVLSVSLLRDGVLCSCLLNNGIFSLLGDGILSPLGDDVLSPLDDNIFSYLGNGIVILFSNNLNIHNLLFDSDVKVLGPSSSVLVCLEPLRIKA